MFICKRMEISVFLSLRSRMRKRTLRHKIFLGGGWIIFDGEKFSLGGVAKNTTSVFNRGLVHYFISVFIKFKNRIIKKN